MSHKYFLVSYEFLVVLCVMFDYALLALYIFMIYRFAITDPSSFDDTKILIEKVKEDKWKNKEVFIDNFKKINESLRDIFSIDPEKAIWYDNQRMNITRIDNDWAEEYMYYSRVFTHLFYLMTIVIIVHFGKTLTGTFTILSRYEH